jgi:CheY-like chemotaxis protein
MEHRVQVGHVDISEYQMQTISTLRSVLGSDSNPDENIRNAPPFTILLADDEAAIRALISKVLRDQGYEVLEAEDGVDALEVADRHHGPVHLLLTDWRMPRLGGAGLICRLSVTHPEAAILIMSGFLGTAPPLNAAILLKPVRVADLLKTVRDVLEFRSRTWAC